MSRNTILSIALVIIAYIVSAEISYALFSQKSKTLSTPRPSSETDKLSFDDNLPKTEECPLNGALYSKKQKEWWEKHRPLGVMVENHEEARPQSGLGSSDVIYEAVAEGAITRFLAVFYCQNTTLVGPVRSARTYFLDWISEYGDSPLYAHVGGANTPGPANALGQIEDYGWVSYNDLSQFSLGYPTFKKIDRPNGRDVATEHTVFSSLEELWKTATKRKLTNVDKDGKSWDEEFVKYSFKDDAKETERGKDQLIQLEFWKDYKQYAIDWTYDPKSNLYKRINAGVPHTDRNNKEQLTAKTVIVLTMTETHAFDGYQDNIHLLYKNKGVGKVRIFMDGKEILGTWKKDTRTSRTLIFNSSGEEVKFNRGTLWFEILPTTGVVNVS